MPGDAQRTLRAFAVPTDIGRDTKVLWFFPASSLPALLGATAAALGTALLPLPLALKIPLVLGATLGTGAALALDAPAKVRRWRRCRADSAARYVAAPTDGGVRGRFADGSLGVALAVLPPSATGRDADALEAERTAWVRAVRRRARVAISVEMVPDTPPRPGWDVPGDLPLPPNAAHFAAMRRAHFEALIEEGRTLRPQVLLRIAGSPQAWGTRPDLHLDRLANGVAGELQGVGAFALPIALEALRQIADAQWAVGPAAMGEGAAVAVESGEAPIGSGTPEPTLPAPVRARPRRQPALSLPAVRLPRLSAADEVDSTAVPWPDVDALALDDGRTWDIGLAVIGAVPPAGATTALLAWARARPDVRRWLLVDANLERPGGLALEAGAPPGLSGWRTDGAPDALTRADRVALLGPGQPGMGSPSTWTPWRRAS